MNDDNRWEDAENRLNALRVRLDGAPSQVKHAKAWQEADAWVAETLEHTAHRTIADAPSPEAWWEDFERLMVLHTDALDVALEEHRRKLDQEKRKRQQVWAKEKDRLKASESSFLVLKILMILSWTAAVGLGLSTRSLGILALATAVPGVVEILRQLRALPPNEFVVERQAMFDLHARFKSWLWAFVAAGVIGTLFALVKGLLLS